VSERIPLIKTIDPSSSEASQLLSALSEFANGAKENVVEMVTWPSDFFHWNEDNQTPKVHEFPPPSSPSPPPPEKPPKSLPEPLQSPEPPQSPEPLQSPEPTPTADSTSRFLTVDGSKVILVLDMEMAGIFHGAKGGLLVQEWLRAVVLVAPPRICCPWFLWRFGVRSRGLVSVVAVYAGSTSGG